MDDPAPERGDAVPAPAVPYSTIVFRGPDDIQLELFHMDS